MRAIADEAHQWGVRVAAHAHGAAGIKAAIRAGIDTIEHASLIDDEGDPPAPSKHGTWFAMDIYNTEYTQAEGAKNGVLEDNLRKDREIAQIQRDNFRAAHRAGVQDDLRHRCRGACRTARPASSSRLHGRLWDDAARGDPGGDPQRRRTRSAARPTSAQIAPGRYGDIIAVAGDPTGRRHACSSGSTS